MKRRVLLVAVMMLVAATAAWAQVPGRWTAKVPGPQGESEITLVLKVDGTNVTGTINNTQQPGEVEIKEGLLTGDDVSFSLTRRIGEADLKVVWKGKVAGDEIRFTRTTSGGPGGGPPTEIVAKRAK